VCPIDDDKRQKTVAFVSDTPEDVLDAIRIDAQDSRTEARQTSQSIPLDEDERERISELGGFQGRPTTFSWASAKGVFGREGMLDKFRDALGALTDYDDPAEGAEEWIQNRREADATKGTGGASGGRRDAGDVDQRRQRKAGEAAGRAKGEGCDHARDYCEHGDIEACEHLQQVCGYDDGEVETLLGAVDDRDQDDSQQRELVTVGGEGRFPAMDVSRQEAGALSKSWQGYKAAIGRLSEDIGDTRKAIVNARQAARAINGIRESHDVDEMHFDRLHELLNALDGMPESIPETRTLAHFSDEGATGESVDVDRFDLPRRPVEGPRSVGRRSTLNDQMAEHAVDTLVRLANDGRQDQAIGVVAGALKHYGQETVVRIINAANDVLDPRLAYDVDGLGRAAFAEYRQTRRSKDSETMPAPPDDRHERRQRVTKADIARFDVPDEPAQGPRSADPRRLDDLMPPQRTGVIETDDQQTLAGERADPQARFASGERGERGQGETVNQTDKNPGGLEADRREDVGSEPEREQGDLSDVGVSEGLRDAEQGSLTSGDTDE